MDIQLPDIDGCEATAQIRSLNKDNAELPIILAITASEITVELQHCLDFSCNDLIRKPISEEALLERVSLHIRRSRSTPSTF